MSLARGLAIMAALFIEATASFAAARSTFGGSDVDRPRLRLEGLDRGLSGPEGQAVGERFWNFQTSKIFIHLKSSEFRNFWYIYVYLNLSLRFAVLRSLPAWLHFPAMIAITLRARFLPLAFFIFPDTRWEARSVHVRARSQPSAKNAYTRSVSRNFFRSSRIDFSLWSRMWYLSSRSIKNIRFWSFPLWGFFMILWPKLFSQKDDELACVWVPTATHVPEGRFRR